MIKRTIHKSQEKQLGFCWLLATLSSLMAVSHLGRWCITHKETRGTFSKISLGQPWLDTSIYGKIFCYQRQVTVFVVYQLNQQNKIVVLIFGSYLSYLRFTMIIGLY